MEIKEAIGYLQAVADNAQSTPKYQRALEMAILCMDKVQEDRLFRSEFNHAKNAFAAKSAYAEHLREENTALRDRVAELEAELRDERDRFDKLTSFELAEAQELEELRACIAGLEK